MPKTRHPHRTLLLLASACSFLMAVPAAYAQSSADLDSEQAEPLPEDAEDLTIEEDPELPDSLLVVPEEDPDFVPDPNQTPIEDDFIRMPQSQDPWYWRVELRESLGGTSNVDQIADAPGSAFSRTTLSGILRYTFPTQTQVLLRSQGFLFNHFNVAERDQFLAIPLSATVTQWLGPLNVYGGYVPIFSSSLNRADGNIQRFDQDFLLGATYYHPMGQHYLFGGYQFDYLHAQTESSSYIGNLLFAGYRHTLRDDLFWFLDARVQPRGYTASSDFLDEVRLGAGTAIQWHVFRPWLILEARGDYNQIINLTAAERSAGIFSVGLNLITALQTQN